MLYIRIFEQNVQITFFKELTTPYYTVCVTADRKWYIPQLMDTWSPFPEGPETFSHPESHSKISNLVITELFYSHILRLPYTFRSIIFFKSGFWVKILAKKSLFNVFARSKCLPVDRKSCDVMQSTETTFVALYRCEELATQLIIHQASAIV